MPPSKQRRQIAWEAARLLYLQEETEYPRARIKAARRMIRGWVKPVDLPSIAEIREQEQTFARLQQWPALPGSSLQSSSPEPASEDQLAKDEATSAERFALYRSLLLPLEHVMLPRTEHPEGDALYHSLQVFDLARDELPYDEEFLLASLLHEVGQAIDARDHLAAGIEALGETITVRTRWLLQHLEQAHTLLAGSIGHRARGRLQQHESYDELMLLARCDQQGRQRGVVAPEIEEALDYLIELPTMFS